jgi:uncharacterized membrane protein
MLGSIIAAFLASLVEFVEALTIVLAVGSTRGWRAALQGTALGAFCLMMLVTFFGPALQKIPLQTLQLVIGSLLLLFGMRWLRKAILRAAGWIALHDETAAFAKESAALKSAAKPQTVFFFADPVGVLTAFKAVLLEGLEVVFIVIATGSVAQSLWPAIFGATAAGVLVIALGFALHRPLARVPENSLKFAVGVLLSSFGAFWVGEGLGFHWPAEDLSILGLVLGFLLLGVASALIYKKRPA